LQLRIHPDRKPFLFPEATAEELALCQKYRPYTRTREHRQWTLLKAVEYVDRQHIAGDIVECGVWRGGNVMMVKEARRDSAIARRLWLFDTFAGMAPPGQYDFGNDGSNAEHYYEAHRKANHIDWCYASLQEVTGYFREHRLLGDDVVFRQGMVENTLRSEVLPDQIAILRLDTVFYDSTKAELEVLFPRLSSGGVLIVDDYGDWLGVRKAVGEYFAESGPLFLPIDSSCRMAIKM